MVQARKRVSYIIPSPSEFVPRLQLPPLGVSRLGATGPLLVPSNEVDDVVGDSSSRYKPRHRLGIASLALDSSTQLVGHKSPEGILYSGGRDGLIMSWDLGLLLKRRRLKEIGSDRRKRAKWEVLTGWGDDVIDEETDDDERPTSDGDVLGEVMNNFNRRKRATASSSSWEPPYERQWETDLSSFEARTPTHFRQGVQAHTDWVNDILLCNFNQTVISASSDGTVKAWNPHATPLGDASTIGTHSDYVRCLVNCHEQNWIASGSFDRTIKLWDLNSTTKNPIVTLNLQDASAPKSSIYALAVDPFGQTIASGSPERVVRLWDPRSGRRIGKLVGHTDNIRAILISADSKYLLTGSADASIKLWSLISQRCLHTFAHHTESVWSLYSDHASLEVFYSGDRSGLVCRVDVEDCTDLSEGECVLLCNESLDTSRPTSEGINKLLVMDDKLLWTASGTSTLKRWNIPQRRTQRSATYVLDVDSERVHHSTYGPSQKRRPAPLSDPEGNMWLTTEHSFSGSLSMAPSLRSLSSEPLRDREVEAKWSGLPYDSLVKLISANDPFPPFSGRMKDPEVATLYSAASIMSVPRQNIVKAAPLLVHPSSIVSPLQNSRTDDTLMMSNTARVKYEERELAADAIPICTEPDFIIPGDAGLVRCIILNDRMHALTVDTLGEVGVWDIVRGTCLGRYKPKEVAAASHSGSSTDGSGENERSPRESLEAVRERIEGEAVVSPWCMADTKAGVLTIHLLEKCFEAEVYADEVGYANFRHFTDESRLNLGGWVLRSLFLGFIREEIRRQQLQRNGGEQPTLSLASSRDVLDQTIGMSERLPSGSPGVDSEHSSTSTTLICAANMIHAVAPNVPIVVRSSSLVAPLIPLHPHLSNALPSITQTPIVSGYHSQTRSGNLDGPLPSSDVVSSTNEKEDNLSRSRQQPIQGGPIMSVDEPSTALGSSKTEPSTSSTPTGLMGRLRNFGRTKRPNSDTPATSASPIADIPTSSQLGSAVVEVRKTAIQKLLSGPLTPPSSADAPTLPLPQNTTILISEEGSPSYTTIYRGLVSNSHDEIEALEQAIPMWLAEYLLLDHTPPAAPPVKIGFVLVPWNRDQDMDPLPELLNTQHSKLTANRTLRIRKILGHVQDKLDRISSGSRATSIRSSFDGQSPRSPQHPSRPRADDAYEIVCNDVILPLGMTLVAVRQYIWKSSAELVLHYRRKKVQKISGDLHDAHI